MDRVLLQARAIDVFTASATTAVGVGALAAGFGGWIRRPAAPIERIALVPTFKSA